MRVAGEDVARALHHASERTGARLVRRPAGAADGRDAVAPAGAEAPVAVTRPEAARAAALGLRRRPARHRGTRDGGGAGGGARARAVRRAAADEDEVGHALAGRRLADFEDGAAARRGPRAGPRR